MNRKFLPLVILLVVAACTQGPDYLQIVSNFESYKNDGDLESTMKLFSEDASLHFGSLGSIAGLEQIRGINEYDLALNTRIHFEHCAVTGSEVTCRVTETNDWLKTVNIDSIVYDKSEFIFAPDGRIQSITSTLSAEAERRLGAVMAEFDRWARANQPGEYAALFSPDGAFVYSHENGEKVLKLLRKWREEQSDGGR